MKSIIAILFIGLISISWSQERNINNGVGFGFNLQQYQKDFGIGINVNSAYFLGGYAAARFKANQMFYEHPQTIAGVTEVTWSPYYNLSLGLVGVGGKVGEHIRAYGEGGLVLLLPSASFSSQSREFGGYGLFGLEFFMENFINYFIEIGSVGTGARADFITNKPIYSNGLSVSAGFRFNIQ